MQIIINIPEDRYNQLMSERDFPFRLDTEEYITDGTILPKGHGRLIDADALEVSMAGDWHTANEIANCIKCAPTIIEADKESE